ncbi:hypothetical protein GGR54DRAFT_317787 [Hypoxylon sp. NC1633]|nr:hypothetical protein GGR54DRAFT_317787 [Hypoxylon sp. NC1633]
MEEDHRRHRSGSIHRSGSTTSRKGARPHRQSRQIHRVPGDVYPILESETVERIEYTHEHPSYDSLDTSNVGSSHTYDDVDMTDASTGSTSYHQGGFNYGSVASNDFEYTNTVLSSVAPVALLEHTTQAAALGTSDADYNSSYPPDSRSNFHSNFETSSPVSVAGISTSYGWSDPHHASTSSAYGTASHDQVPGTSSAQFGLPMTSSPSDIEAWGTNAMQEVEGQGDQMQSSYPYSAEQQTGSGDSRYDPSSRRYSMQNNQGSMAESDREPAQEDEERPLDDEQAHHHDERYQKWMNDREHPWTGLQLVSKTYGSSSSYQPGDFMADSQHEEETTVGISDASKSSSKSRRKRKVESSRKGRSAA